MDCRDRAEYRSCSYEDRILAEKLRPYVLKAPDAAKLNAEIEECIKATKNADDVDITTTTTREQIIYAVKTAGSNG